MNGHDDGSTMPDPFFVEALEGMQWIKRNRVRDRELINKSLADGDPRECCWRRIAHFKRDSFLPFLLLTILILRYYQIFVTLNTVVQ